MPLHIVRNDITKMNTDAIVNAVARDGLARNPQAQAQAIDAGFDVRTSAAYLQNFYLRRQAEVGG